MVLAVHHHLVVHQHLVVPLSLDQGPHLVAGLPLGVGPHLGQPQPLVTQEEGALLDRVARQVQEALLGMLAKFSQQQSPHFNAPTKVTNEPVREKTYNLGSDQVGHKPDCTVTEDS